MRCKFSRNRYKRLGANAIVNVRIDFDNISAKAMSMFMISITGTAVRISGIEDVKESDEISSDDLEYKYRIRDIKDALKESTKLGEERWSFILTNDVQELTPLLYEAYCKNNGYGGDEEETARFETYAEQWIMWFNSKQREEPYQGLTSY